MISFELAEPKTLNEAIALLDAEDPEVRPISGGTALMLMMKSGVFRPSRLVSLQKVEPDYSRIERGGEWKPADRRAGHPVADRTFRRGPSRGARHREDHASPVECARAQCRAARRQSGARRSAHGSAAGVVVAGREGDRCRPVRSARDHDPGAVQRLLRDRAEARRADHVRRRAAAGRVVIGLYQMHDAIGRRLACARHRLLAADRGRQLSTTSGS